MFCNGGVGFRPVEDRDLEKIRILRNCPSTWEQLSGRDHVTPADQPAWFASLQTAKDRAYYTAFIDELDPDDGAFRYEGDFLGVIRTDEIDLQNRSIRIGLDIEPSRRGMGWGTKLYAALLRYMFDFKGFHRVWLEVLETNAVGLKLYLNAGFREEGRLRQAIWRNGRWNDYVIMSILEDEYRTAKK